MMRTELLRLIRLHRHGTFRLGMDVIFLERLLDHDDSLPHLTVLGRMTSCRGLALMRGINGAQTSGVLGEIGETNMMCVTSRSSAIRRVGTECHTGIMGAGAPTAVRSERNGIHPVDFVAFDGPTDHG